MTQDFELNKKRIERLGLTCSLMGNDGKVRYFQDGHEYVEIGGLKWGTCNVGAKKETDYGLYFQWGDTQGYTADQVGWGKGKKFFDWKDYTYDGYNTVTKYNSSDGRFILEPLDDAARFHMGGSWRMPTAREYIELCNAVDTTWVINYQDSGVNGGLFTDKTDSSKTLFFPACGYCLNGSVYLVGSDGNYWSSSLNSSDAIYGCCLNFYMGNYNMRNYRDRFYGFSVRGVCD